MQSRDVVGHFQGWGFKKVAAVAAVLAVLSISLATWAVAGRSGSTAAISPASATSPTTPAYVTPTKASATQATTVEGITGECVQYVYVAQLGGAMQAANLSVPASALTPAEMVNKWYSDYPSIAAGIIGLQDSWTARVVPLVHVASLDPNVVPDQDPAAVARQFKPQVEADCRSMATQIINGTASAPVGAPAPAPVVADVPVADHRGGSERVTRTLPPLPKYWTDTVDTSNTLFTSCVQAMLDAVPRIAAGQDASVRSDYASTPNLLYWLELEASRAPKGSLAGALVWMNAPDPTGHTDGEKEGVAQECIGWAMP